MAKWLFVFIPICKSLALFF